jgi:hypothetical protein
LFFFSFFVRLASRFFVPTWLGKGGARRRGQDGPKATAAGGMVLTAASTAPSWWGRAEDRIAADQMVLRRMTAQTVRAILLANATAATSTGLRARS